MHETEPTECDKHCLVTDHNNGETICAKCGVVVKEERLKTEMEWKPK